MDGLRYNAKVITPGAQTERRGDAGPVRVLLGGGYALAALFSEQRAYFPSSLMPNS
jgi:hypothetical protein